MTLDASGGMHYMSKIKFGLAITTYNRADRLIPFVQKYETYDDLDEILITDDCSSDYEAFRKEAWAPKIRVEQNQVNLGAYHNKLKTLSRTRNNWVLLFDSDNFFEKSFLDVLQQENSIQHLDENIIYCPSGALPNFDYSHLSNQIIDKTNWNQIQAKENCFINTGNMLLSRKAINFLLSNLEHDPIKQPFVECKYMNYLFVKNGFKLKVVPGLVYQHAISHDSFYLSHQPYHSHFDSTFNWILS